MYIFDIHFEELKRRTIRYLIEIINFLLKIKKIYS
jgi:hypothetical protein